MWLFKLSVCSNALVYWALLCCSLPANPCRPHHRAAWPAEQRRASVCSQGARWWVLVHLLLVFLVLLVYLLLLLLLWLFASAVYFCKLRQGKHQEGNHRPVCSCFVLSVNVLTADVVWNVTLNYIVSFHVRVRCATNSLPTHLCVCIEWKPTFLLYYACDCYLVVVVNWHMNISW